MFKRQKKIVQYYKNIQEWYIQGCWTSIYIWSLDEQKIKKNGAVLHSGDEENLMPFLILGLTPHCKIIAQPIWTLNKTRIMPTIQAFPQVQYPS